MDERTARARRVIDTNLYLVLGTADADGNPWTSPVFYAADGYRDLYWVSSPDVVHSVNLAVRPRVSIVIFDSTAPVGQGGPRAVHLAGDAVELAGVELEHGLLVYPGPAERGGRRLTTAEVTPGGPYRMYRARISQAWAQCRIGDDPCVEHGLPYAHRVEIDL